MSRRAFLGFLLLLSSSIAWGHVFPIRAAPRVGSTVTSSPERVSVLFDGELEPVFSKLRVEDKKKLQVDQGDCRLNDKNNRILEVTLHPNLPAGGYKVYWTAIARDGHKTMGDFRFRIKK